MKVAIIGGGIAGLATAIAFEKNGIIPVIYEAAAEIKPVGAGIALSINAYKALRALGLEKAITEKGNFYKTGELKTQKGQILTKADLEKAGEIYGGRALTLSRPVLHDILRSGTVKSTLISGKKCTGYKQDESKIKIQFSDGSVEEADYVIAADGIHSAIRKQLLPESRERYSGQTCWRGICHEPIQNLDITKVIESWGPGIRFGIVPVSGGSIYWFAVKDEKTPVAGQRKVLKEELVQLFGTFHAPVQEIIEKTRLEDILWNDLFDLIPISRFTFNNILLIGDAAHATTPNLGQGGCMALEDAAVLKRLLRKNNNLQEVFQAFEKDRIERTTKIVNASYRIGKMAHLKNRLMITIRNFAMKIIPQNPKNKFLDFLFGVDFN